MFLSCSKIRLIFMIMLISFLSLTGCRKADDQTKYAEYEVTDNTELGMVELSYEGIIYRPYGVFGDNRLRGEQIGIRKGDPESKICVMKGYDPNEWIVEYLDVFMGGGNMLFKAVDVEEIPAELEKYKAYD